MIGLAVDIYEGDDDFPVVSHIFWGKTRNEAKGVSKAHEETDAFYRGAVRDGKWNEIQLSVDERWIKE